MSAITSRDNAMNVLCQTVGYAVKQYNVGRIDEDTMRAWIDQAQRDAAFHGAAIHISVADDTIDWIDTGDTTCSDCDPVNGVHHFACQTNWTDDLDDDDDDEDVTA